jgi:hypothetical protein
MSAPTRFPSGVSSQKKDSVLGDFPFLDPFHTGSAATKDLVVYSNDFVDLGTTTAYTIVGGGTWALVSGIGGQITLTPVSTVAASVYRPTAFQFVSGNKFWYLGRLQLSAIAGINTFYAGLQAGSAVTDGIWFTKPASSTSINVVSVVNSVATTLFTGIATAVAATWVDVGFYYDGANLTVYVNDALVGRVTSPTIGATGTTLTNALLCPSFGLTPVGVETMTFDYMLAACEVTR